MNKYLTSTDSLLWSAGLLLELLILVAATLHRHQWRYPAFISFVAYSALQTAFLMYLVCKHVDYGTYWISYWGTTILRVGALVAVAIEIFGVIFKPLDTIPPGHLSRLFSYIALIVIVLVAAGVFFPAGYKDPLQMFFKTLDRTATFIILLSVAIVLLKSERIGIPKNMKVYGISLGLLFTLSVDAAKSAVGWIVPTSGMAQYHRMISMSAFTIAGLVWLYYFSKPEPKVKPPTREQLEVLLDLATSLQITKKKEIHF